MDHKTKRQAMTAAVTAASAIVSLICIVVISSTNTSAGPKPPANTTSIVQNTSAVNTTSVSQTETSENNYTQPVIYTNPTYDFSTYGTASGNNTISKTPSPAPVTPTPVTQLSVTSVSLNSFNNNEAVYRITVHSNKQGNIKLIAVDRNKWGDLKGNISAKYIKDVFTGSNQSFLSTPKALAEGPLAPYDGQFFRGSYDITVNTDIFDMFVILDDGSDDTPLNLQKLGGIPIMRGAPEVIFSEENNTLIDHIKLETTIDTDIVVKIIKSGRIVFTSNLYKTNNCVSNIYDIDFKSYAGGSAEAYIVRYDDAGNKIESKSGYVIISGIPEYREIEHPDG